MRFTFGEIGFGIHRSRTESSSHSFSSQTAVKTLNLLKTRARGKLSHLLNVPDRSVEMNTTLRQRSDQYKEIKPLIESKSRGLLYRLLSSSGPSV
jgi:hypothetical protein